MSAAILLPDMRIGHLEHPVAQNSHFGWILWGRTTAPANTAIHPITIQCHHTTINPNLDTLVKQFFDSEQVPEERCLTEEEQWFVKFFNQTCTRQPTGKYMVRLPIKTLFDPNQTLGRSKQIALRRFQQLERRLQRTDGLMERYSAGINDYFELNQIVPAISSEDDHCTVTETNKPTVTACYLPHHPVIREDSLTTKLRVVYDASASTSNGKSLNDILCIGPALQNELPAVILNWRTYEFVFIADIQKMYRCIDMHPDDIAYQTILWRNKTGDIQEFCLTTVTFGTGAAPCLAISVVHRIADDEKERYPLAEEVLKKEMYVDDVQSGGSSIEIAIQKRDQVKAALASAGMELRKWASNHPALLDSIPIEHQCSSTLLSMDSNETIKTLGMYWQPNGDIFKFKLRFDVPTSVTKRSVLSTVARLYDPLGFITPVIVTAKIILKRIWNFQRESSEKALKWDDNVPEPIQSEWLHFINELPSIDQISVPRWIDYSPHDIQSIQLHTFCDGATTAFSANVYIRIQYNNGMVYTHLLIAKGKVTPTKPITIPRVELCGAELASRLASWAKKNLRLNVNEIPMYFWCDATIVLHWIKGDISRWKTFVANRVSKILSKSSSLFWNHVDTKENPADCATRGLTPSQLKDFGLWWNGPDWLLHSNTQWPQFNINDHSFDDITLEAKSTKIHVHATITSESLIYYYSSLTKLVRITAWILRYTFNARKPNQSHRRSGALSVIELQESLFKLIQLVQAEAFGKEISCIQSSEPFPTKSKIRGLAPIIDKSNILRVRGRLQRSNLPYRQKHPIIIPNKHHFTRLLIDNSHQTTLHGGTTLTLSHLRQKFWVINGRQTVGSQIRKCIICFRNKPELATQMMGNLPYHRVNPSKPFSATGIDYTGAIELKSSRFRGNTTYKGYIVIFICLATKAIHLEAATGMSTEHFLMALHRFIGRRGICRDIFSDNGTNFVGADNLINPKVFTESVKKDIVPKLAEKGIQWHCGSFTAIKIWY
ncbi:uncharacterized protein LOC116348687 [Contarinia nasturtii]|uniref:uncharacterized protein LOC116348687 n=1 Tax=Contarinia nasturtii TaxID=265458 RepID=UPI0012D37911|nr:uncharacterized protein LOC116348687 [Contarinia nasturtii]